MSFNISEFKFFDYFFLQRTTDCNLNSYRINLKSNYKKYMDQFVLRIFENGLYNKHLQWATALINALFRSPPSITDGFTLVFTVNMISGVFNLYFAGLVISSIVFLIENIYVKCLWSLFKN